MRLAAIILCTFLLTFSVVGASAVTESIQTSANQFPLFDVESAASFFVQDRGLNGITLEVVLPPTADRLSMQGLFANPTPESQDSPMPYISRWIVIPDNVDVNLHVTRQEGRRVVTEAQHGITTYVDDWDISITDTENFTEINSSLAIVGRPASLRGIRMVPVLFHPIQKLDNSGTAFENHEITIELEFTPSEQGLNRISRRAPYSQEFAEIIENLVVNPPARDLSPSSRSRILIVHSEAMNGEEDMINDINAFAEWKRRLGFDVVVHPIDVTAGREAVKEEIRAFYDDEQSIEFLIIMGHYNGFEFGGVHVDEESDSPYYFPTFVGTMENRLGDPIDYRGDQFLVTFDEDDNLPDVIVGRFMCTEYQDLSYALTRVIQYEQNPVEGEWFTHALFSAATDVTDGVAVPPTFLALDVVQWTDRRLREMGYTEVTNIIDRRFPEIGNDVLPLLEDGVSLALSETWLCGAVTYETVIDEDSVVTFEMTGIANTGRMHPFAITNHQHYEEPILEPFFNSGSAEEPSGPVSAFGMWRYPYDLHLSHILGWSVWAMQNLNTLTSGYLFQYAGMQLNSIINFDEIDEAIRWEFKGCYQFLGDPTVNIRNAQPTQLTVVHPETFNTGATLVSMRVTADGSPVDNVIVCIRQGEMQFVESSDGQGNVRFTIPDGLVAGELQVTASKSNYIPYVESPAVGDQAVNIVLEAYELQDGALTNGQSVGLGLTFRNIGEEAANNLTASFSSDNEYMSFSANQVGINGINAGQTGGLAGQLQLILDPDCPGESLIQVRIDVNSGDSHWLSAFEATTSGPRIVVEAANDQLVLGRVGTINPSLSNVGDLASVALTAELTTSNPYVTITVPNRNYQAIGVGRNVAPNAAFSVRIEELFFPGSVINFELLLSGAGNYNAVIPFEVGPIGEVSPGDPLGPDNYGYICFDSHDAGWEDHPIYNWIEISSNIVNAESPGTKIGFDFAEFPEPWDVYNATEVIQLPFPFRYYGTEYRTISVCTNGWLSFGADDVENRSPEDWQIPGPGGVDSQLNVYHTDLEAADTSSGGVYYYFFEEESKFIVEWSRLDIASQTQLDFGLTFQIILYNPAIYTTPTGDGEIIFQYKEFGFLDSLIAKITPPSFGIRNADGSDGLEYYHNFEFPAQAMQPEDEFALKFTTAVQTGKGSVSGRVVQMGEPEVGVASATVDLHRVDEIVTDGNGNFRFDNLREGHYLATINAHGYSRVTRAIDIVDGEDLVLDPILLPSPQPHVEVSPLEKSLRPDASRTRADVLLKNNGTGTLEYQAKVCYADGRTPDFRILSQLSINEMFGLEGNTRAHAPLYVEEQDLFYVPVYNSSNDGVRIIGIFNRDGELQRTIPQPMDSTDGRFKSLAWDGANLWGSFESYLADRVPTNIYILVKMDAEGAITDTIIVPFDFYRLLPFVFAPDGQSVYVTEAERDLVQLDLDGNVMQSWQIIFPGRLTEVSGMGYYPFDTDGMPLYLLETRILADVDPSLRFIKFNPENGDWRVVQQIPVQTSVGNGQDYRATYGASLIPPGYRGTTVSFVVVQAYGANANPNDQFIEREIGPNVAFMVPRTIQNMSGEIEPGGSASFGFEVEGNGWPEGQYHWSYVIHHNAPGDSIVVPVTLTLDMNSGFEPDEPEVPAEFGLHSVYPNPFNHVTRITFGIEHSALTSVNVFDLNGRQVETLFNGTPDIGEHTISWNATDMPSGLYLVHLQSGSKIQSRKVVLLK